MRVCIPTLAAALLGTLACSGTSGPAGSARVTLRLATSSGAASAASRIASAADVLVVEGVQVVARKIRLGQVSGSCPASDEAPESNEASDGCPIIKLGPVLLEPPVVDGAIAAFTADLPAGSYDRLRIQIHKPTGSADREFLAQYPDLSGVSIRVAGTFNGAAFTFATGLTAVEEIRLDAPLEVVEGTPTDVTLVLDVAQWFQAPNGASVLDPTAPDQQTRSRIEQNIRRSLKAYRHRP